MTITAEQIRSTIDGYLEQHPQEKTALASVLELLDAGADLTDRKEYRAHATAGAVLLNHLGESLLIHHIALDKWLTPGGHLEEKDRDLRDAALRELIEETGIAPDDVTPIGDGPIHIDVHPIPANPTKGEDAHQHVDFRFLFTTSGAMGELQEEEVNGAAWCDVSSIADDNLRSRVASAARAE